MKNDYIAETLLFLSEETRKNVIRRPGDYVGEDGLEYCGTCGKAKQMRMPEIAGIKIEYPIVYALCDCDRKEAENCERANKLVTLREKCFTGTKWYQYRFENDDHRGDPKPMKDARIYADNIEKMLKENYSMVFYGSYGVGKSFLLGCIANAVMEQGHSCLVTDFPTIISQMYDAQEKEAFLDSLCRGYDLLLIDDLFTEQQKEYPLSVVWSVIERRDKYELPIVYSTNVSLDFVTSHMKDDGTPLSRSLGRICSRIFKARPVECHGKDRRAAESLEKYRKMKELFGD